jgi:hypothetical protein
MKGASNGAGNRRLDESAPIRFFFISVPFLLEHLLIPKRVDSCHSWVSMK